MSSPELGGSSDVQRDLEANEEVDITPTAVKPFYGTLPTSAQEREPPSGQDPLPTWLSVFFALIVFFAFAWFIYASIVLGLRS